ncbi:hypothetical protein MVES1_001136 [Malassezia vespertilionis]|uniref:uncharacterized protein n=1 Tax=Malassezia vespertilionis TaxID=2020962 RepID=UPI0024B1F471|nr:uncharacterized protein MVES1_001136 [Malassezia vespertilionis]WFD05802.1 hypothetical protein MVES1_001136 [Malassezia vespertilionis]
MSAGDVEEPCASPAFVNPYEGNRNLTPNEQVLLGEYVRLAQTMRRQVAALSTQLSASTTHASVLNDLRVVERKMGLVLTLFKASVWAIVMQQNDAQEEEMEEIEEQYAQLGIPEEDEELLEDL